MDVLHVRWLKITMFALLGALVLALALVAAAAYRTRVSAATPSAPTDYFTCTPATVAAFTDRVHVRCSPTAPGGIAYFAYCSAQDSAMANRFLSVFTTAKVTGKNVMIFYTPSDLSGASCGCSTGNCRVLYGAEVQP